ncbi:THO complex subunit 7 homolog isoform X1 [Diorhabda carinulata]|uniref:THO complex subunit 7 homolog isoform X1 n=1 Tax=Diorhabda sublineata TaxID=1163346 RepID=UPI0024E140BA|nr:THO complex subunit 7 homolog isoform X1 [Diorhabda sublineata]XP_057668222.1 THO complex subunit 7 homolog isoform X1 [Diorhabda carinulata]
MSEEEVIKRRLIFDGDGTGDDRRFNLMLKMITKLINTVDDSPEDCKQRYDKILAQLCMIEHSRSRSELITKSNDDQLLKYQQLHGDYEDKIKNIKEEIIKQRVELEKAKTIKQNRIEYDLLAKQIAAEPPRTEMNKQLIALQKQLKDLGEEKRRLVHKLDKRKKQFNVLSTSANQLKIYLNEDTETVEINSSLDDVNTNSPEPMSE